MGADPHVTNWICPPKTAWIYEFLVSNAARLSGQRLRACSYLAEDKLIPE